MYFVFINLKLNLLGKKQVNILNLFSMLLILQEKQRFSFSAIHHVIHIMVSDVYMKSTINIILCSSWFLDLMYSFISFEYLKYIYVKESLHYQVISDFWRINLLVVATNCFTWWQANGFSELNGELSSLSPWGIIQECLGCPALWMHS